MGKFDDLQQSQLSSVHFYRTKALQNSEMALISLEVFGLYSFRNLRESTNFPVRALREFQYGRANHMAQQVESHENHELEDTAGTLSILG